VSRHSSNPASGRRSMRRRFVKPVVASVAAGLATTATVGAIVASAAVPTFPDNLVVFPDRDFISVEGFQDHVNELATVEVSRPGVGVIGSAQSTVAGGDVAFEVNHPGGVCWGAGTDLQVTPDIKPGDVVTIKFAGDPAADTTVQDAFVNADAVQNGAEVTVTGHINPDITKARTEQRIVEPALVDTAIGRRDVRALPGPVVAAPKGGYSSGMEFPTPDTFKATYVFDDPANAKIAANAALGERMMAWQAEDAAANRQGLTIAEFGELGGPGMGGCPAGPTDQAAPQPGTASAVRSATDKSVMQVNWVPITAQPGAQPVTGYSVEAIAKTTSASGEQVQIGKRTGVTDHATITGLDPAESYDVEVRSLAGPRMSEAFTVNAAAPAPGAPADTTRPTLTATPAPGAGVVETKSVTLAASDPDDTKIDIYYTTDGSAALSGDLPSDSAKLYTAGQAIAITAPTQLNAVAFDPAGNSDPLTGSYAPPSAADPPPAAPAGLTATAGQESVTLRWTADDPAINRYGVQVYDAGGAKVGPLRETTVKNLTISGLTAGTQYFFTVSASNDNGVTYGPETGKVAAAPTRATDQVTITTAKWKSGDFRVTGTASVVGATVSLRVGAPDGPSLGNAAVTAAAPPATGGVYDFRLRNGAAPASNPGTIYVVSNGGGVAGPFRVTNA
jgi:Chitobiase/beta-hexosaminidase C-terminal domain/Fibronectin type III domain